MKHTCRYGGSGQSFIRLNLENHGQVEEIAVIHPSILKRTVINMDSAFAPYLGLLGLALILYGLYKAGTK